MMEKNGKHDPKVTYPAGQSPAAAQPLAGSANLPAQTPGEKRAAAETVGPGGLHSATETTLVDGHLKR